ncbi:MAG: hypothetical protein GY906_22630 [bacterium]|nr:hypothetical protein [bacterium]
MTALNNGRTITRETGVKVRGRTLVVEAGERTVSLRRKGTRAEVATVPWDVIYDLGLKRQAAAHGISVPARAGGRKKYRV